MHYAYPFVEEQLKDGKYTKKIDKDYRINA
jgi:hypothetical protein